VDDIDVARDDLVARRVDVREVFHYAGGERTRLAGPSNGNRS